MNKTRKNSGEKSTQQDNTTSLTQMKTHSLQKLQLNNWRYLVQLLSPIKNKQMNVHFLVATLQWEQKISV